MASLLRTITEPHDVTIGSVTYRVAVGGLTLPAIMFLAINDLPATVRVPFFGALTPAEVIMLAFGTLVAVYAHEAGHVIAGRTVNMPIRVVALDKAFPSVEPDNTNPDAADPRRRFWFAVGGAINDMLLGVSAVIIYAVAPEPWRWLFAGYLVGAAVNALNVLPLLVSGIAVAVIGAMGATLGDTNRYAVTLIMVGMVVTVIGMFTRNRVSDGDLAVRAWREWRHPDPELSQ